ncbi:MAG: cellulase family glycosylhydrolase [Crocinitomicaceae bacterium]|nr:cellulase family glycosylhydrolase [Crocinitomicaceae bacterium]
MRKFQRELVFLLFVIFTLSNANAQSTVSSHGALSVTGNRITNQYGDTVSFAGNSMFWSNTGWEGAPFYNASCVSWLQSDWNATIVRAAMGVEDNGGYLSDTTNKTRLKAVVDAAIANDMYVIIDWHSHHAENYQSEAIAFFQEMATLYGSYDNVIYEIYNEPLQVSWSNTVKPYATAVISAIRAIDPDNLIVVGTPTWSQDVDVASMDPIVGYSNIAYTLHFYAGTHGQSLRNKAITAMNNGIALFVTEWGTVNANGGGGVAASSVNEWANFMCQNKLSHCNWSICDKNEGASAVIPGSSPLGNWSVNNLTSSGATVKSIVQTWDANCSAQVSLVANDAGISSIPALSGDICSDSISPEVVLNNYGSSDLSSVIINYSIDNGTPMSYTWNGILTSGQSVSISLPSQYLSSGSHSFNATTISPNGVLDSVSVNDSETSTFNVLGSGVLAQVNLQTDCWGTEVNWILSDSQNNPVGSGGTYGNGAAGTLVSEEFCLVDSCYTFTINDSFGDGMNGVPSGCPINGYYNILNAANGDTLASMIALDGAYGNQEVNPFCVTTACSVTATSSISNESCVSLSDGSISVNPSSGSGPFTYSLGAITNTTGIFNNLAPGTHVISIVDDLGCQGVVSESVLSAVSFGSLDMDTTICEGAQVALQAYGGNSYTWSQGGNQIGLNNSILVSPTVNTIYDVDISNGICTELHSVAVNVVSIPNAGFSTSNFCDNSSNVINNVVVPGGIFTHDGVDGSSIDPVSGLISNPTPNSDYLITYSVSVNGCSNQSTELVSVLPSPAIDGGSDISVCNGDTIILNAINPNGAQISWDNGILNNTSFVPLSSQTYTVTASLNGCIATDNVGVIVASLPSVNAGSDFVICSGSQATLSASNPDNAQISWNNGVTDNIPFTPITNVMTYTVTASLGACTSTDDVIVSTVNSPLIDAGIDQTGCEGDQFTLTANNPDNANISWNNGINDGVPFIPQAGLGIYTVSADLNGCVVTDSVTINSFQLPVINAGNDIDICDGAQVTLTAINPSNAQLNWDNSVIDNVPFTPISSPMTYTVVGVLNGCSASDQVTVTTLSNPGINAGMDQTVCEGETIVLIASNPDNAIISWDNNVSNGVPFNAQSGLTTYTATANLNGCTSSDQVTIDVSPAPIISGIITNDNGQNTGAIDVTISSGYTIVSTSWSNNALTEDIENLSAGSYTIEVEDENGCTSSQTFVVASSLGVESEELFNLVVSPNPSSDFIKVVYPGQFSLNIMDLKGRVLIHEVGLDESRVDLSELSAGTYVLFIENSGVTVKVIKI